MQQTHTFIKDDQGWFINLVSSPFDRGALAMVAGADTMLDIVSQGQDSVTLNLATDYHEGYEVLDRKDILNLGLSGANYIAKSYKGIEYNLPVWLCPVTLYVFMHYPKTIYYQVA